MSKNQTNPLKRRDRLVWFFMHFRGPKALHGRGETSGGISRNLKVVRLRLIIVGKSKMI